MYTAKIINATITNTTIAHIIPAITPADVSSDESVVVVVVVVIFLNESKKAFNISVEVKFSTSSDSNSKNKISQQMNMIYHL